LYLFIFLSEKTNGAVAGFEGCQGWRRALVTKSERPRAISVQDFRFLW
jgi:hypothetical protein